MDRIKTLIYKNISQDSDKIMYILLEDFKIHYNRPVSNITEMRSRESKKIRGDMLEEFCKLYFENVLTSKGDNLYHNVWLFSEIPSSVKITLKLGKQDLGIDLILQDYNGEFSAVQVKYRQHPQYKSKNVIGWKQLSTFYALVNRTGPWVKHIIFTNADYVRHVGEKDPKDRSYCIGSLRKIKKDHWLRMIDSKGFFIGKKLNKEEIRIARLKTLDL